MPLSPLNLLPVPDLDDLSLPAWQVRDKWLTQLRVVESMLVGARNSGPFLALQLESLRFLAGVALAQINTHNLRGGSLWEPASEVEALNKITKDFIAAVPRARAAEAASGGATVTPR